MALKSEAQYVVISASTLGDNTLVAGVADKKIRVLAVTLIASGGANTIRFESNAGGTALTGTMDLASDGQLVLPRSGDGWFETLVGELLNLELSAGTLVAGALVYQEVDEGNLI